MRYRCAACLLILLLWGCRENRPAVDVLVRQATAGDAGALHDLVEAMGDGDRQRSTAAYKAVVEMGEKAVPALERSLSDGPAPVAEAAAAALGSLDAGASVPALTRAMEPGRPRRYAAAWALGEIGDESAIRALIGVLADPDTVLRKNAVRALVKIGHASEGPTLKFLTGAAGGAGERPAIRVLGELRSGAAVPALSAITGDNRDAASWALGRTGDRRALKPLLSALADQRWQVRRQAAEALGSLEDAGAVAALEGAKEDEETVVREWAARSLETITGQRELYRDDNGDLVPPYNLYR